MALTVGELVAFLKLDPRQFNQAVDQSETKFRGFGRTIGGVVSGIQPAAAAIGLSFGAVAAGIGMVGLKAISMSANMEQSRIAFTTMLGDAKAADSFIRQLQNFAANTPFEFVGLQENAKRLLAMGFAAKDIVPTLTNVGDAVAALGSGQAGIDNVTYALGQMKTAGKVHTQDMMQLTNAGIGAWQMLADKLHTTVAKAQDEVQNGAVSSEVGLDAIMTGMHAKYSGLMAKQSHTVTGLFSNLQDIANQSLTVIGDAIVSTFDVKGKIGGLTNFVTAVTNGFKTGGLKGALAGVFEGLGVASDYGVALDNVWETMSRLGDAIGGVAKIVSNAATGAAKIIFGDKGQGFWDNLDTAMIGVAAVVGGVLVAAFAALAISVLAATWPLLLIGAGVGLLAIGAYQLFSHWDQVTKAFQPFTKVIGPKVHELMSALAPAFAEVRKEMGPIAAEFSAAFKEWEPTLRKVANIVGAIFAVAFTVIIDILKVALPAAIELAIGAIKNLGHLFDGVGALLRGDWGRAWDDFKQAVSDGFATFSKMHIPLPHFALTGGFDPSKWAVGQALPGLNVSWYDKGGLFRGANVIGVGEKRPEMVGALDDVFPLMVNAFKRANSGGSQIVVHVHGSVMTERQLGIALRDQLRRLDREQR
jgi:tape measure domain-containing protein